MFIPDSRVSQLELAELKVVKVKVSIANANDSAPESWNKLNWPWLDNAFFKR